MDKNERLSQAFVRLDERLLRLERQLLEQGGLPLEPALNESADIVRELLSSYGRHAGKEMPDSDDLLDVFKAFVHGDPSLNAVRDNVRELVYYYNCLSMDRADALPKAPERMAVRMARHIYLYLRSRSEQEGRLE